jgi:hypothetical protein
LDEKFYGKILFPAFCFFPIFGRKLSLKNKKCRQKFQFSATFWQTFRQKKVKRRENGPSHAIFRPKMPMCTKNEKKLEKHGSYPNHLLPPLSYLSQAGVIDFL